MNAADYTPLRAEEYAPLRTLLSRCQDTHQYVRAILELTYRCNFSCPHCYVHTDQSNHGCVERELTTPEWLGVIDQLAEDGCLVLTLTGGEVLARRDWYELACHARHRRFLLRVFTNASYIDDTNADRLAAVNAARVEISLYGATADSYRAIAGHEVYLEQSCRGIDRLVSRGVPVAIKAPLMRQNFDELQAMTRLAEERWGKRISFSPHIVQGDDRSTAPLDCQLSAEQFKQYLAERNDTSLPGPPEDDRPPCSMARDYLVISPFGDVFPCVNIKRSVGNVRERRLREIWDTAPYLEYLRSIRVDQYRPYYTEEDFRGVALCPGAVFRETGSPVGPLGFMKMAAKVCREVGGQFACGCN